MPDDLLAPGEAEGATHSGQHKKHGHNPPRARVDTVEETFRHFVQDLSTHAHTDQADAAAGELAPSGHGGISEVAGGSVEAAQAAGTRTVAAMQALRQKVTKPRR
jgi:hypothetical protein